MAETQARVEWAARYELSTGGFNQIQPQPDWIQLQLD
jgi:hypothetical protein